MRELWRKFLAYLGGNEQDSRIVIVVLLYWLLVPLIVFFGLRKATSASGDTRPVAITAASLILEGNWNLDEYVEGNPDVESLPYWLTRTPDGIYSNYPSGMVVFALPVAVSARLMGASFDQQKVRERIEKWSSASVAVASVGLFFLIAVHVVPVGSAYIAALFFGLGSALFSTVGQGLWQHGGIIFFSLVIVLVEFRSARRAWTFDVWIQGGACAMMLGCRLSSVLFIVPFGIWVLLRSPRRAFAIAAISTVFFLPWAGMYWSIYSSPFGPSSGQLEARLWTTPGAGLVSVLFSPGRGLFVYQPWLFLGLAAVLPAVRRKGITVAAGSLPRGWMVFCLVVPLFQIAMVSSWGMWWGGHCWGSRLVCEGIPLLGLLCLPGFHVASQIRAGRIVLVGLLGLSLFMHLPAVYLGTKNWDAVREVDSHPECLWSWSDAPFFAPFRSSLQ